MMYKFIVFYRASRFPDLWVQKFCWWPYPSLILALARFVRRSQGCNSDRKNLGWVGSWANFERSVANL